MPMTPFDTLVISPKLQMMKLMLPYTPASSQRLMALFIKFTELQNTMRYFEGFNAFEDDGSAQSKMDRPLDIFDDLRPYMSPKDSETMDMMMSAMSMMEMMNGMDMPDMSSMGDMSGMMDMMNMFSGGFPTGDFSETNEEETDNEENEKGNQEDGKLDESSGNEEY